MKRAIVLSGGGSRGAYQIGVWKALKKLNIRYDIVTGTSIGSINGIMMVQKEYKKALYLWKNIKYKDLFDVNFSKNDNDIEIYEKYIKEFIKHGGVSTEKIYQLLKSTFNEKKFYKSNIDYAIVTFNLTNFKPVIIMKKNNHQDLLNYVLASSTCFPVFKMTDINNEKYIDGGYYDNLPINTAISMGASEVIAIDLKAIGNKKEVKNKNVNIINITPNNDLGSFLIFDKNMANKIINYGYNDTMKLYKKLDGKKYTFKKNELIKNFNRINKLFTKEIMNSVIEGGTNYKIINKLFKKSYYEKIICKKDYKYINDVINDTLEYCGLIFSIDDTLIYSIKEYNKLILKKFYETNYVDINKIDQFIKTKKFNLINNKIEIIKYIYNYLFFNNKLELYTLSKVFKNEFLSAIYIKIIEK